MNDVIGWLRGGPTWVAYRVLADLLDLPEDDEVVRIARQNLLAEPKIQALIAELAEWPGAILKRHNDAGHPVHKLAFLADLGINADDPGMGVVIGRILAQRSPQGIPRVMVNIPPAYGGSGVDQYTWMLCDAPLVLYALLKFGLQADDSLLAAIDHLANLVQDYGWPCAVSSELGKFRGPGRKSDPCPYANLAMLKVFAQMPEAYSEPSRIGAETLLTLWQQRRESRPYLFAMGSDFTRLKAPLIWYDLLHMVDVLSTFPWLQQDPRLQEMLDVLQGKADEQGRFKAESAWMAWKDWEFGQKKQPSRWITLLAVRGLKRSGRWSQG